MKIKKAALTALALVLILSAFVLSGCEIDPPAPITGLPDYTFENIEYPDYRHQERWLEPDEGMTIDGKLDEEVWSGQNYLRMTGNGYTCNVTTVFGEKGVYFGIAVDDPYVYVNPIRADWQNTGIELHIARAGVTNREEAVMLRLTACDLNVGSMQGSYAEGHINGYVWDWVPFYVKSYVDAEMEEGIVATSECNGLSWEILLPWEALGMSGPGDIVCLPAYNHCEGYDENAGRLREHIQYLGDMFTVQTWPMFTANGSVIEQDAEDDVIGDGLNGGQKTAGWDLTERDNGKLVSTGGNVQEIWFREEDAQWYMIEVTMSNAKPHNDVWPSGGIILSDDHHGKGVRIQLFIGYDGNGQQWFKVYDLLRSEPPIAQVDFVGDCGAKSEGGVKMKVIRHYKDFWVYINDVLMYKGTSDDLEKAGTAGLYTVGMDATFTDYKYTAEPELPGEDEIPVFNPDVGTEKIGDAIDGSKPSKTTGWDLTERENGKVSAITGGVQEIWFREQASEWYMIETTISNAKPSSDVWPSGGIVLADDGQGNGIRIQLFIGYNGSGNQWFKVYDLQRSEPPIKQVDFSGDCGAKSAAGAKLKVIRYYKEFWVYVNDTLMYYGSSDELSNAGIAGLYTVGMEAVFTDCKYTAQPEVPTEKVEEPDYGALKIVRGAWDTSKIDDKILTSTGGHQEIWFDVPAATKYTVTVTVSNVTALNDDWPSVGILVGDDMNSRGIRVSLFSGFKGEGSEHWFKSYDLQFREPPLVAEIKTTGTSGIETAKGVELKVVRDGTQYWFYIGGELMYSGESDLLSNAGFAGFYSNGCSAVFSDYSYEINE